MKLKENELVDRYLYYLCRYIPYDQQEKAEEEFLELLEKRLPFFYSDEDVERELNALGNPYSYAMKYNTKGSILISGKNYEIFTIFLKLMALSAVLGFIFFFFNYFARLQRNSLFEILLSLVLTTFGITILSSWIVEKIKSTKILNSLMKSWRVDQLFENKKKPLQTMILIFVLLYSGFFYMLILYVKTGDFPRSTHGWIVCLFFLNVLRDTLRLNESGYADYIFYMIFGVNLITISTLLMMTRTSIPNLFIIQMIMVLNLYDIIKTTYDLLKNKNLIRLRHKRKRNQQRESRDDKK